MSVGATLLDGLPPVVTAGELADRLRVEADTVRRACREGRLRSAQIGRVRRIARSDAAEWIDREQPRPTSDADPFDQPHARKLRSAFEPVPSFMEG